GYVIAGAVDDVGRGEARLHPAGHAASGRGRSRADLFPGALLRVLLARAPADRRPHRADRSDDCGGGSDGLRQGDPGDRGGRDLLPLVWRRAGRRSRAKIAPEGALKFSESILDLVGNTPLVRLHKVAAGLRPTILAKLEELNPGGSVKDRIGLTMIEEAERNGQLRPGGTIIEPTSGNTGHGLAMVAAIKGYKMV